MSHDLRKNLLVLYLTIGIISIFIFAYIFYFADDFSNIQLIVLEYTWLVLYIFALYSSVQLSGLMSIFSMFLILSFVFNYGRIFLDLFTDFDLSYVDLFHHIKLSLSTEIELLGMIIIFLSFSLLTFLLFYKKSSLALTHNKKLMQTAISIMIFSSVPLIYNYIIEFKYILTHGYLSIFTGELHRNSMTILPQIFPRLMTFGFMLFLAAIPHKKEFKRYVFLYIFVVFLSALKGQRGELLLTLIYLIWYYHNIYHVKFNKKIGVLTLVGILFLSQFAITLRSDYETNLLEIPYEFLRLNGISICVPSYLIEYKETFKSEGVPYIFAPIYDYFYRVFIDRSVFYSGPSIDLVNTSNYLSFNLTYYINETAYFLGHGTGTSYLAEFYDLGGIYFGAFALSILIYLMMKWEYYLYRVRWIMFLSPIVVSQFLYMPRDAFFKIIDNVIIYSLMYIILKIFLRIRERKLHENSISS